MTTIAFIGVGNMGGPMARNLLKAGFSLVVHDIDAKKLDPLVAAGAAVETSPAAVAGRRSDWRSSCSFCSCCIRCRTCSGASSSARRPSVRRSRRRRIAPVV